MTESNVEDVEENLIKLQHKSIFQAVWKDLNKWDEHIFWIVLHTISIKKIKNFKLSKKVKFEIS